MQIVEHPLANHVLEPAPGDEDTVVPLPVQRGRLSGGAMVQVSHWRPDAQEMAMLLAGGTVMLAVLGKVHPPIAVEVAPDFRR